MRKKFLIIGLIIFLILIIPKESDELRIRVIANSNSIDDQNLKYEVVDILKKEIAKLDKKNLEKEIKNNIHRFDQILNEKIKCEYSIKLTKVYFPPKEKDGKIIRGGKYKTLLVVLGNGKGKNWWSILNPNSSYIFEDEEANNIEFRIFLFDKIKKLGQLWNKKKKNEYKLVVEIKSVNEDNINDALFFLESLLVIKDINRKVVLNGEYVLEDGEIIGFLSFEEFDKVGLIRYFVFKKVVSKNIISELFKRISLKAKDKELKLLITMVVKDEAISVFKDLGFEVVDRNDVYIDEINILQTRFKDAIILKYNLT